MKNILLVRHAKSDWSNNLPDIKRPLSKRGRHNASQMKPVVADLIKPPVHVISSSSTRTRETTELLFEDLESSAINIEYSDQLYLADLSTIRELIKHNLHGVNTLVIVAHNPGMDHIVESLAGEYLPLSSTGKLMTTCAIAHFIINDDDTGLEHPLLQNIIRPKELS